MSQAVFLIFISGELTGQWQRRVIMVLNREAFLRETYLIHPLILFTMFPLQSRLRMNMHVVLPIESKRMRTRVRLRRGSACSTIWPRFSLLPPPCISLLSSLTLVSCRAGNLLNSHIYSELWCCPKHTHTHTHVRCTLYGPHRSKSSFSRPLYPKWICQGFLLCLNFLFFLFFFYRSDFYLLFSPEYRRM